MSACKLPDPAQRPQLDGVPIQLGGFTYILPPCSLTTLKRHSAGIDKFAKAGSQFELTAEMVDLIVAVLTEALARNYPDVTAEAVADHVGVDTMSGLFQAALDVSGLIREQLQARAPRGAAQEGGKLGESNGTASSPTS
ncbi:MAG: hypothetical protein ABL907_16345 [Hyphomicrobium sp.]